MYPAILTGFSAVAVLLLATVLFASHTCCGRRKKLKETEKFEKKILKKQQKTKISYEIPKQSSHPIITSALQQEDNDVAEEVKRNYKNIADCSQPIICCPGHNGYCYNPGDAGSSSLQQEPVKKHKLPDKITRARTCVETGSTSHKSSGQNKEAQAVSTVNSVVTCPDSLQETVINNRNRPQSLPLTKTNWNVHEETQDLQQQCDNQNIQSCHVPDKNDSHTFFNSVLDAIYRQQEVVSESLIDSVSEGNNLQPGERESEGTEATKIQEKGHNISSARSSHESSRSEEELRNQVESQTNLSRKPHVMRHRLATESELRTTEDVKGLILTRWVDHTVFRQEGHMNEEIDSSSEQHSVNNLPYEEVDSILTSVSRMDERRLRMLRNTNFYQQLGKPVTLEESPLLRKQVEEKDGRGVNRAKSIQENDGISKDKLSAIQSQDSSLVYISKLRKVCSGIGQSQQANEDETVLNGEKKPTKLDHTRSILTWKSIMKSEDKANFGKKANNYAHTSPSSVNRKIMDSQPKEQQRHVQKESHIASTMNSTPHTDRFSESSITDATVLQQSKKKRENRFERKDKRQTKDVSFQLNTPHIAESGSSISESDDLNTAAKDHRMSHGADESCSLRYKYDSLSYDMHNSSREQESSDASKEKFKMNDKSLGYDSTYDYSYYNDRVPTERGAARNEDSRMTFENTTLQNTSVNTLRTKDRPSSRKNGKGNKSGNERRTNLSSSSAASDENTKHLLESDLTAEGTTFQNTTMKTNSKTGYTNSKIKKLVQAHKEKQTRSTDLVRRDGLSVSDHSHHPLDESELTGDSQFSRHNTSGTWSPRYTSSSLSIEDTKASSTESSRSSFTECTDVENITVKFSIVRNFGKLRKPSLYFSIAHLSGISRAMVQRSSSLFIRSYLTRHSKSIYESKKVSCTERIYVNEMFVITGSSAASILKDTLVIEVITYPGLSVLGSVKVQLRDLESKPHVTYLEKLVKKDDSEGGSRTSYTSTYQTSQP